MTDVDDLIAQTVGTRPSGNAQCWARKLEGKALEYLTALEDVPVEDVYQAKAVEILDALGYPVSAGQVSDHLHGKCRCRK